MKTKESRTILLWSGVVYFVAGIFWRVADEQTLLVDLLNIVALGLLLWGAWRWDKERRAQKTATPTV